METPDFDAIADEARAKALKARQSKIDMEKDKEGQQRRAISQLNDFIRDTILPTLRAAYKALERHGVTAAMDAHNGVTLDCTLRTHAERRWRLRFMVNTSSDHPSLEYFQAGQGDLAPSTIEATAQTTNEIITEFVRKVISESVS